MIIKVSENILKAINTILVGDRHNEGLGFYRSGPMLVDFFNKLGFEDSYGQGFPSRNYYSFENLKVLNKKGKINLVIKNMFDPLDYIEAGEETLKKSIDHANKYLKFEDLKIEKKGKYYSLTKIATDFILTPDFNKEILNYDNIKEDFEKALQKCSTDIDGALTAACSTLESLFKTILDELNIPYPKDKSISGLSKVVLKELNLSPDKHSEPEIKRILGGLTNIISGIGVLRTGYWNAHGKGKKRVKLELRHAKLVINSCTTTGLFILETYKKMFKPNE